MEHGFLPCIRRMRLLGERPTEQFYAAMLIMIAGTVVIAKDSCESFLSGFLSVFHFLQNLYHNLSFIKVVLFTLDFLIILVSLSQKKDNIT